MHPFARFDRVIRSALHPVALACAAGLGIASWVGATHAAEPLFAPVPPVAPVAPVVPPAATVQAPGALSEQARQRLSEQAPSSRVKAVSGRVSNESQPVSRTPVPPAPVLSTARQVAPNHLEPLWGNDAVPAGPVPAHKAVAPRTVERPPAGKVTRVLDAKPPAAPQRSAAKAERQARKGAVAAAQGVSPRVKALGKAKGKVAGKATAKASSKALASRKARTPARASLDATARRTKQVVSAADGRVSGKVGRAKKTSGSLANQAKAKRVGKPVKAIAAHARADKAKPARSKVKAAAPRPPQRPTQRAI